MKKISVINGFDLKSAIILFVWLIVNCISVFYYSNKYVGYPIAITLVFLIFTVFSIKYADKIVNEKFRNPIVWLSFILFLATCIYFYHLFPKETNGNDKWSDIVSFWDFFLSGKNGWAGRSHLGNRISSMPTNLILAFPFYYFKIIDFFSLFSFLTFWFYVQKNTFNESKRFAIAVLIIVSPAVFMEVSSRSNLLINGVIYLFAIDYLFSILQNQTSKNIFFAAILMGVALGYRLAFAPAFIMLLAYLYVSKSMTFRQLILYAVIVGSTLIVLFLPFVWGHLSDFTQNHPFIKQAKITKSQTILVVAIGLFFVSKIKGILDVYFYTIILVFIAVLLGCFQYTRYTTLLYNAMIFPFAIKYLLQKNYIKNLPKA
jgi:hypothetical protein